MSFLMFPFGPGVTKEPSEELVMEYVNKLEQQQMILTKFGKKPAHEFDLEDDSISFKLEECEPSYQMEYPVVDPPLLPLRVQRAQVKEQKKPPTTIVCPKTGTIISYSDRFQPNDPLELQDQLPSHVGNSWCDQSIVCSDQLRMRAPFFFYDQRFDKLNRSQAELLEEWQTKVHAQCNRQKNAMQYQLELCHSFNDVLNYLRPKCWQTGLTDIGQLYAYRYKEMMRAQLGHNHHDRNSSRNTLTRFSIPFNLLDLEGLTPMQYLLQYCVLSETRTPYYQRIFSKFKDGRTHFIPIDKLFDPLNSLMSGSFHENQVVELVKLLSLDEENSQLGLIEFNFLCAVAERLFYCKNIRIFGEEGLEMQQGLLEMVDFHMFVKKMDNVRITQKLQTLLHRLDLYK